MQLSAYQAEKFPKHLVKKVAHRSLTGRGKYLSKAQVNWMLETSPEKPRERSKEWSLQEG